MKTQVFFFAMCCTLNNYGMNIDALTIAIRQSDPEKVEQLVGQGSFDEQNKNYFKAVAAVESDIKKERIEKQYFSDIRIARFALGMAKLVVSAGTFAELWSSDPLHPSSYYILPGCATFCGVDGFSDIWKSINASDSKNLYADALAVKHLVETIKISGSNSENA